MQQKTHLAKNVGRESHHGPLVPLHIFLMGWPRLETLTLFTCPFFRIVFISEQTALMNEMATSPRQTGLAYACYKSNVFTKPTVPLL